MCVFGCHLKNQAHTHITFTSNLVVTHTLFQPPEWKNPVGFLQTYTEIFSLSLYVLQLNSILVSSGSAHLAPDKALLAIWALCCMVARISRV